jgi:hypothetical protein
VPLIIGSPDDVLCYQEFVQGKRTWTKNGWD